MVLGTEVSIFSDVSNYVRIGSSSPSSSSNNTKDFIGFVANNYCDHIEKDINDKKNLSAMVCNKLFSEIKQYYHNKFTITAIWQCSGWTSPSGNINAICNCPSSS